MLARGIGSLPWCFRRRSVPSIFVSEYFLTRLADPTRFERATFAFGGGYRFRPRRDRERLVSTIGARLPRVATKGGMADSAKFTIPTDMGRLNDPLNCATSAIYQPRPAAPHQRHQDEPSRTLRTEKLK